RAQLVRIIERNELERETAPLGEGAAEVSKQILETVHGMWVARVQATYPPPPPPPRTRTLSHRCLDSLRAEEFLARLYREVGSQTLALVPRAHGICLTF